MARYHIFLSYSRKDSDFTFRLQEDLEADGLRVWIDRAGIQPGTPSWRKTIEDAIHNSQCLLVVFSPDAKESHWVNEELNYAQTLGKRIFYVLARGDERTAVPFGHSAAQWIDMREVALYAGHKQQLSDAVFNFLGIDSDTFKAERLLIEEERRRQEHEDRARRAREEARRIAQEQATALPPQSHPQYVEPVQRTAAPVQGTPLASTVQGVPGHLYRSAAVQPAGHGPRFIAFLIDTLIVSVFNLIIGLFIGGEILGVGIGFLVGLFYNVYFWTSRAGQTPAKSLLSIRVVSKDGGAVTVLQAVIRYVGYYINTFVLLLGWLWAIVDGENEGLHDKLAGTRVVRA